jgi:predicted DNA binding protein
VDEILAADPSVEDIVETEEFDREKYYQVEWTDEIEDRVNAYIDKEGSILEAEASAEGWQVHIRFANRDQFDTFRDTLSGRDHSFTLLDLTEPGSPRQTFGSLTPDQRDGLVAALEAGYFSVPRETTIQELADELETSHQALSELLRRGTEKLIDGMLTTSDRIDDG